MTLQRRFNRDWANRGWANRGWANRGWANRGCANRGCANRGWANRGWATIVGLIVGLSMLLVSAVPVGAQDFVKVDDAAREQLPATPFIGVAYGFIWVAILVYVLSVARRLGRVQGEIQDLRRRLDRSSTGSPPRG